MERRRFEDETDEIRRRRNRDYEERHKTLEPAFILSATDPYDSGYDPESPDLPYVSAGLTGRGGYSHYGAGYTLSDQVANDELIIGSDPRTRPMKTTSPKHKTSCTGAALSHVRSSE